MTTDTLGGLSDYDALAIFRQLAPRTSTERPSEWVARSIVFNEANNRGPFMLTGREYARDILDDFARGEVTDETLVFGSQVGKTSIEMAGVAWSLEHSPGGILWVMDSIPNARKFSKQRFGRMLRASPGVSHLIPTRGLARHDVATLEMILGPSTVNFTGSNSPGNLASTPCRRTILDEVDKFDAGTSGEADAVSNAEQRTKDSAMAQRWKTSTPTLPDGLIWTAFLEGDQRRYFVPCPRCSGLIVLAWSKDHTAFELTGAEAFISWDQDARRQGGEWDLERVESTAHATCPHCGASITDKDKPAMNAAGQWRATARSGAPGHVSRHIPSLYSCSPEVTWGKLAVRFLKKLGTVYGLQGFINGDLAEPFIDRQRAASLSGLVRREAITSEDWIPLLTVDVQQLSPHFWYVVRKWRNGSSVAVDAGPLETWEAVRAKQIEHAVPDTRVFIDSGDRATEVYQQCWQHHDPKNGLYPVGRSLMPMCWSPLKGDDGRVPWKDAETGVPSPVKRSRHDPFFGSNQAGIYLIELLTFRTDTFKDVLEALREKRLPGVTWEVAEAVATPEYHRHLMSEENRGFTHPRTGRVYYRWAKVGSKRTPNHLLDCEVMQLVGAFSLGLFNWEGAK